MVKPLRVCLTCTMFKLSQSFGCNAALHPLSASEQINQVDNVVLLYPEDGELYCLQNVGSACVHRTRFYPEGQDKVTRLIFQLAFIKQILYLISIILGKNSHPTHYLRKTNTKRYYELFRRQCESWHRFVDIMKEVTD